MTERIVPLDSLTLDWRVNIRADLDEPTVLRYMEILDQLPPVIIVQFGEDMLLSDGFHRMEAAARLGRKSIRADVRKGTLALAVQLGSLGNLRHGLPLQDEELELAVWRLHQKPPDGPGWSQRQIAGETGMTQKRVWTLLMHHEQQENAPVNQVVATAVARAPKVLQRELARAAVEEGWSSAEVRAIVREVENDPDAVRHVMQNARPHLVAMRERLTYVRMFDNALHAIQQLDSIGITPERLVGLADLATQERWRQNLPTLVRYAQNGADRLNLGGRLRALPGGER